MQWTRTESFIKIGQMDSTKYVGQINSVRGKKDASSRSILGQFQTAMRCDQK